MPPITDHFDHLTGEDWEKFAADWMSEISASGELKGTSVNQRVVLMNFTSRPLQQWKFIKKCISFAKKDSQLGHIAAGPLEHLLGRYGDEYLDVIKLEVEVNPKLKRTFAFIQRYTMSDKVWEIVKGLQSLGSDLSPLNE